MKLDNPGIPAAANPVDNPAIPGATVGTAGAAATCVGVATCVGAAVGVAAATGVSFGLPFQKLLSLDDNPGFDSPSVFGSTFLLSACSDFTGAFVVVASSDDSLLPLENLFFIL